MKFKDIFKDILLYGLLYLACFNFLGRGPVIYLFFCLYGIIITCKGKSLVNNKNTHNTPYILLSIFAFFSAIAYGGIVEGIKPINFALSYVFGVYSLRYYKDYSLFLRKFFFVSAAGFASNLIMIYYLNMIVMGHDAGNRVMIDFWTGEIISVTIIGLLTSYLIGYSYYCLFVRRELLMRLLGFIYIALTIILNNETATRTPFLLLIVSYSILTFRQIRNQKKYLIYVLAAIAVCLFMYDNNTGGLRDSLINSAIYERINEDGIKTSRTDLFMSYAGIVFDYPFGGNFGERLIGKLPHNFIQEIQNSYGIIALTMVLYISILFIKYMKRLFSITTDDPMPILLLSMFIIIFLQGLLEPVNSAYPQLLWLLFVIGGFSFEYLRLNKNTYAK